MPDPMMDELDRDAGPVRGLTTWCCPACGRLMLAVRRPAKCSGCGGPESEVGPLLVPQGVCAYCKADEIAVKTER